MNLAKDPLPWTSLCIEPPHVAQWVAWNVCQDAWYGAAELTGIRNAIDHIDAIDPGLTGAALLARCARTLRPYFRAMTSDECDRLPVSGVHHITASRMGRRFELALQSAWAEGSIPGEADPGLPPGTRVEVVPRVGNSPMFVWLTFEVPGTTVPRDPDSLLRLAGLPWMPAWGGVVRVEVTFAVLRTAGAYFALPTIFDAIGLNPNSKIEPDWRARPASEHRLGEPWGHTRDLQSGGAALPEVIADIAPAGTMAAEYIGTPSVDWSTRPFLAGGTPR